MEDQKRDFFISYTAKDQEWAKWIAWQLEAAGLTTFIQAWDFGAGSDFAEEMNRAAFHAQRTIALLSPDYFKSGFGASEWHVAFASDPVGRNRKLIPIRVRECDIEGLLRVRVYIDLVGKEKSEAKDELLRQVCAIVEGSRLKPDVEPDFPSSTQSSQSSGAQTEEPQFPGASPAIWPAIWNIPFSRNPHFTGRDTLIAEIEKALSAGEAAALTQPQAITGLGGVGKTQLAVEYAYRHTANYDIVWWVRSEEPVTMATDFAGLGSELIPPVEMSAELDRNVEAVKRRLERMTRWLVIFDNAPDAAAVAKLLTRNSNGHTLITSRDQNWRGLARPLQHTIFAGFEFQQSNFPRPPFIPRARHGICLAMNKLSDHEQPDARTDEQELGKLGYAQELFRTMGGFSNFAISFSIISILTGAVTLYGHGLKMGGPAEMAFGWPLVTLFTLAVVCSMAELASALPTSGAMYHWSCRLGGKGWGWFTAWFNIIGQIAAIAGIDYGCALFVTPLIGLKATTQNLLIVYAAILLSHALINHFGIRLVAWLNDFSVTVHIVGVIAIVGALLLFAPKQPASFFFARITNNDEGWPYWWAFIIGLLQAMWTFTGYDASASVSEETVDPRRRAPWGMVMAVVVSSVVGYLLLIALTLSIKNIYVTLNTDTPVVIAILVGALGERAGTLFSALAAMAMWFCGLSAVTWSSRVIWAFARDEGLPASGLWKRVSHKRSTPTYAIWLCAIAAFLGAAYSKAYLVVTSISTIGLYISYVIPVFLHLRAGKIERGPWHLGRYSRAINVVAVLWVIFLSVILSLADIIRTGISILAVTTALALWYGLRERQRFKGPSWAAAQPKAAERI